MQKPRSSSKFDLPSGQEKNAAPHAQKKTRAQDAHSSLGVSNWACIHRDRGSEITCTLENSSEYVVVADVYTVPGINVKRLAEFITQAASRYAATQDLLKNLQEALDACLACDGRLTWDIEQEMIVLSQRIKARVFP